jgi:hypothetical protein
MKILDNLKTGIVKAKTSNYNINLTQLILGVLILAVLGIGAWKLHSNKVDNLEGKLATEIKLKNALIDTISVYQNKRNEWVVEKLTIQESIKNLEKMNGQLSSAQNELIARVKELNKSNTVIAAALIQTQLKVDSLLLANGSVTVDTNKKTIEFTGKYVEGNKKMNYGFTLGKVLPAYMDVKPTLKIDLLEFPNTQTVDFHWKNNKQEGYPIAFSVSNSNDFYKTVNIESYAIKAIDKEVIDPNGWQKIGAFFKKTGNKFVYIGIGVGVGIATYAIFLK